MGSLHLSVVLPSTYPGPGRISDPRSTVEDPTRRLRRIPMKTKLSCPCGELIKGDDEDDLVEKAFAHLREKHPDMAEDYERHHILFMAY
jgi:hypothetical protein